VDSRVHQSPWLDRWFQVPRPHVLRLVAVGLLAADLCELLLQFGDRPVLWILAYHAEFVLPFLPDGRHVL
jgi:hypothetical protein